MSPESKGEWLEDFDHIYVFSNLLCLLWGEWSERGQDQQVRTQLESIANNQGKRWCEHEPSSESCHFFCVCFFSVTKLCPTLYGLMNYSMPCFPILHYLPEFAQTHVHWVSDAIQPSHPLSTPFSSCSQSFLASLFQWVGSSHQVAKVLELQFQYQSFQWMFRVDFL